MELWTPSRRDAFRYASFVEIEVAEASHSKVGVNALLCQRHDLKSYSLFSSFFALVHRSHQQDSAVRGDELLLAHLRAM